MLFSSPEFVFVFLPITFVIFAFTIKYSQSLAIGCLIAASLVFYGCWNGLYLLLLIPSILFNYMMGHLIGAASGTKKKILAICAVAANLSVLAYFKYTVFVLDNINFVVGTRFAVPAIILPLGISFITFQKIAYIVDAYKGKTRDLGLLRFALFVSFFPQLIAGPIAHHSEIMPQLGSRFRFSPRNVAVGLSIFSLGLFKKVMIADGVAYIADAIFTAAAQGQQLSFLSSWAGALAFTVQIYFDFSGYSDMACGLSIIFGIRLPMNFNSPYKSTSIIEFWRRWHISLSRFLRDYLYIPLGGNRKGPARRYANLLITMLLGGLWHGAGWTFVVWGAYHGLLLLINHAWRSMRGVPALRKEISIIITFLAVVVGWVLFKADRLATASAMYGAMLGFASDQANRPFDADAVAWAKLVAALAAAWFLPNAYQVFARYRPALGQGDSMTPPLVQWRPSAAWALVSASAIAVCMMPARPVLSFLYFQF